MHRHFAGFGDEQEPLDAYEVAVIQPTEKLPAIDVAATSIIACANHVLPPHVNLQTRRAVRQVHERRLAHHPWRRSDASRQDYSNLVQPGIRGSQRVCRRSLAFSNLRLEFPKRPHDRSNRVFAGRSFSNVAALKLVRIAIAPQPAQSAESLMPPAGLIVPFNGRDVLKKD